MGDTQILDRHLCPHRRLGWGSGAFYVICQDCSQFWIAINAGDDSSIDYRQGANATHGWKHRVEEKE